jgi:hypothetical protein
MSVYVGGRTVVEATLAAHEAAGQVAVGAAAVAAHPRAVVLIPNARVPGGVRV